jgi:hypothetical protein
MVSQHLVRAAERLLCVKHYRQEDDFRLYLKVAEVTLFSHSKMLLRNPAHFN